MTAVRSPDAVYRKAFFKREFGSISHTDTHERMTHTHTIPKKKVTTHANIAVQFTFSRLLFKAVVSSVTASTIPRPCMAGA